MEPLVFVDDVGGALASLAAAVARRAGRDAIAATSSNEVSPLPPEIPGVLAEVGFPAPQSAVRFDPALREQGAIIVPLGATAGGSDGWPVELYMGPARTEFGGTELERWAWARTSRDRIERRLEQMR